MSSIVRQDGRGLKKGRVCGAIRVRSFYGGCCKKKENGLGFASFESQLFVNRLYFYLEGEKRRHSSPWLVACTIVIVAGCIVVFGKYGLRFVSTDEYAVRRTDGQVCQVERGKVGECGSGYLAHGMKLVEEKK